MPTYEYVCNVCGSDHEVVQSMSDPSLTECPDCGAPGLRKLFRGVGVHFKGSGFYRTDSRDSKGSSSKSSTSTPPKSESSGSDSKPSSAGSSTSGSTSSSSTSTAKSD